MKRIRRLSIFAILLMLAGGLLALPATGAAQQSFQMQAGPHIHYSPRPAPSAIPPFHQEQTIPSIATPAPTATPLAPPQAGYARPLPSPAPVLPAVFRGCWQGTVTHLDSNERIPGGPPLGPWAAKTYQLCYRRVGNGPFQLTFTDTGVEPNRKIINSRGRLDLISTDGRSYATMRAYLHFDEYLNGPHLLSRTFPVDEVTNLQCEIEPDGMHVWGSVVGSRSGTPWFRARWHTIFVHVTS
jgi:hypothetical protein